MPRSILQNQLRISPHWNSHTVIGYFFPFLSDVTTLGFCSTMCALHGYAGNYKFAWAGVPPAGCRCTMFNPSINYHPPADAAVNWMANALAKTVTDPFGTACYCYGNLQFIENADQCSGYFTNAYIASNGAYYNMYVSGRYYLVQTNWNLRMRACTMSP